MTKDPDSEETASRIETFVELGGIPPAQKVFHHMSIRYSVSRAYEAFQRYDVARETDDPENIVSCVHEALGHSASISRFFWPSGLGKSKYRELHLARAASLREMYSLDDSSPLKNRELRDTLEHYDERLDRFLLNEKAGTYMPMATVGRYESQNNPPLFVFKMVDPEKQLFIIFNQAYGFSGIRAEVKRMHER